MSIVAPSFGTVQSTLMPLLRASRALDEMVQATSISPFWNQAVKSGSSPRSGACALSLVNQSHAGCMLSGMSAIVPPPAITAGAVHADAVIVERDPALELRVEE